MSLGGILAGAAARRAGLPAVVPVPGFPALAARAVAARAMAPRAGRFPLIRAVPAGAGARAVALRPGLARLPAAPRADRAPGGGGRLLLGFLLGAALARAVDAPAHPDQRAEGF